MKTVPRVTKKELSKQEQYYSLMAHNAVIFSNRMIQRLGLFPYKDGLLCVEEEFEDGNLVYFTYDGFKYIPYEFYQEGTYLPQGIKVFDPYNDIKLCINCVLWYLQNIQNQDTDHIIYLAVSNQKMNDRGYAKIGFDNMFTMEGNEYSRDCIKYLDLIYKIDEANPLEYKDLQDIDMGGYEDFNP